MIGWDLSINWTISYRKLGAWLRLTGEVRMSVEAMHGGEGPAHRLWGKYDVSRFRSEPRR